MAELKINSQFSVTDNQRRAMSDLVAGLKRKEKWQTLLGVTGSGKTFTMANIIQEVQRPTLVISHKKRWQRNFMENSEISSRITA